MGGTRAAARIEWDKIYSMDMMARLCPENTPFYRVVRDISGISDAISEFESRGLKIVVKPRGLTGGKGVKVMPEHLATYDQCAAYAESLLDGGSATDNDNDNDENGVLLVEKLDGIEFTIMGMTDGRNLVMSPATYDYPYRFEGDRGPGTGGMGCFADSKLNLPFMTDADVEVCRSIMQRVIDDMRSRSLGFTGVLNGGFFKTACGIRFMEFNSRFGDPECLNVISVLRTPLSKVLAGMWSGTLPDVSVSFEKKASVSMYVVAKEYPSASPSAIGFEVDNDALARDMIVPYYASCVMTGKDRYATIKKSRVLALVGVSDTIQQASDAVNRAVSSHIRGSLEYRPDIGSAASLGALCAAASRIGNC